MAWEMEFEYEWNRHALALDIINFRNLVIFSGMKQTNCDLNCLVVEVSRSYTIRHTHTHSADRSPLNL
jgi:hypothetical protein